MQRANLVIYVSLVYANLPQPAEFTLNSFIPQSFEIIHPIVFHDTDLSNQNSIPSNRRKRSALWDTDQISVNISTINDHFQIKLKPNKHLLSPGFKVYHRRHGGEGHVTTEVDIISTSDDTACHFHGVIESHGQAKAALSLCRGVTGVLILPEDDYVIEPLPNHMKSLHHSNNSYHNHSDDHSNAHIIYRRSSLPNNIFDRYKLDIHHTTKPRQNYHRTRRKRSSRRRHERAVETLVVVDKHMNTKHGRENLTTYVLSIFNVVFQLYQDTSLGYAVKILLVGLVFLDGDEPGLHISHHADDTLNSFCQWQTTVSRRKQHDHAVLLTGVDICSYKNAPCDTLGFAPIEGMCNELRSCIVNEDTGLSTAFTVAHEIGHNFGMLHDGDENSCYETTGNIMSPTLTAQSGLFHWSTCSRQYLRNFLTAVQSECLTSQAGHTADLKFPDKLPGEIFDADTQCRWQFGKHSKQCRFTKEIDICENLWCYKDTAMCETKFLPAAEGTACGYGMWCQKGRCSRYGSNGPTPVNGWWTEWGEWSRCSRSCGGGVMTRKRECSYPRPQYGGKPCEGDDEIHKICNIPECGNSDIDFREIQCQEYNRLRFRGWYFKWRAYGDDRRKDVDDQCKLFCKADGHNFFYTMSTEVTDGTTCNDFTADICVQGKCRSVGCDLIVDSRAKIDTCGVCNGDNSTCELVDNTFITQPRKNIYYPVTVIPRGARSIFVEEQGIAPSNYLVLRDVYGKYKLNGNWELNKEGVYNIKGTKFIYRRPYNQPESLRADGPLREDLILEVLIQAENPGIHYSFTIPKKLNHIPIPRHNYTWSVVLTKCSEICAAGNQTVTVHCHRDHRDEVEPNYCDHRTKPRTGTFPCNTQPCTPKWVSEPWGICSKQCGGGKQKRLVYCTQRISGTESKKVKRRLCDRKTKPVRKRECNTQECPPVWFKGTWSECSVSCGKGIRKRHLTCRSKTTSGHIRLRDSMCPQAERPAQQKRCRVRKCPNPHVQWIITSWTKCTGTCGEGVRTRQINCFRRRVQSGKMILTTNKSCRHLHHEALGTVESCKLEPCKDRGPSWYASPWSKCDVSCASGKQTRLVHCIHEQQTKLASDCDPNSKPLNTQSCEERACPSLDPLCVDEFPWCGLVPKHNICHHSFYGPKCCLSCRRKGS